MKTETIELFGGPMDGQIHDVPIDIEIWRIQHRMDLYKETKILEYRQTTLRTPRGHRVYKLC